MLSNRMLHQILTGYGVIAPDIHSVRPLRRRPSIRARHTGMDYRPVILLRRVGKHRPQSCLPCAGARFRYP